MGTKRNNTKEIYWDSPKRVNNSITAEIPAPRPQKDNVPKTGGGDSK